MKPINIESFLPDTEKESCMVCGKPTAKKSILCYPCRTYARMKHGIRKYSPNAKLPPVPCRLQIDKLMKTIEVLQSLKEEIYRTGTYSDILRFKELNGIHKK